MTPKPTRSDLTQKLQPSPREEGISDTRILKKLLLLLLFMILLLWFILPQLPIWLLFLLLFMLFVTWIISVRIGKK
jgi:Ca2+/Na+ antiporter